MPKSHLPREKRNPGSNLTVWPRSSLILLSMILLHSSPSPWANPTTFITWMALCDDSKVYMSSPNLNPIRFICSTALFHLRDTMSQTELILLPLNVLFLPYSLSVNHHLPSCPSKKNWTPIFDFCLSYPQSDTKFYYPIILISFKFSPSSLSTPLHQSKSLSSPNAGPRS